ncbi:adhesion G protein-coupled receptor E5 isoform 11 precursor [Mus musculus]|uniref:adhesion G protein-coupled receptor E5 isoform 11 precursor n=1 Tax=Mus musculus TaxID=10090 RepID=UPI002240F5D4|nr:adhesion G protein-coupled receptor E5 isoform 11 precursor [Mus musculus]
MRGVRCPGLLVVCILLSLSGAGTQKAESKNCAKWCPINSKCVSNRSCVCKPGFSSEKELITNPAESCEDINECLLPGFSCGDFAMCKNSEGSYTCVCNLGYKLLSGAESFVNESENTCQDVDECSSGQHQCHNSTVCKNTVGSYKCHCRPGWKPTSGSLRGPDTICQEPPFPTWTLLPTAHSQTLLRFSVEVQNLLRDFNPATVNYTIQKLIEAVDKLLEDPMETETQQVAAQLLSNLEQSLRTLAQFLPKGPFTYTSPSNTELSLMVKEQDNKDVTTVHHGQTWMELDWAVTAGAKISENGSSVAGILSSPNMEKLLGNTPLNLEQRRASLEDFYGSPIPSVSLKLLSNINSVFLTNTNTEKLASNVTFKFDFTSVSPPTGERGGVGMLCGSPPNQSQKSGQRLLTYMVREN